MKIIKIFPIIFCISLFTFSPLLAQKYASGVVFVKLKINNELPVNGTSSNSYIPSYVSILNSLGAQSIESPFKLLDELMFVRQIQFDKNANLDSIIRVLKNDNHFEYVSKLQIPSATKINIPNEPQTDKQWYFKNININNSWNFNDHRVKVRIAVIDNAIRTTHEDIADNLYVNVGEIPNNGIDDDNNGYIDDVNGYDFGDNDNDPNPPSTVKADYFSHGTHVAGIISASNINNKGLASLCPNAELLPIKVVPDNPNYNNDMLMVGYLQGLEYAIKMNAKIINCSWGFTLDPGETSPLLEDLINIAKSKNIIIVAAAGNNNNADKFVPAAYPYVISVGSTNENNIKSNFSNFGSYVDVMAPGENIYSTLGTGDHDYGYKNGTSMSAPIVSSFIGQILSQFTYAEFPKVTTEMEEIIKENCENIDAINPNYSHKLGTGIIDIDKTFIDIYSRISNTSVINSINSNNLKVYPNPNQGVFYIQNPQIPAEELLIKVYDLSGKLVNYQHPQTDGELQFVNLYAGAYMIAVYRQNVLVHHEKVMIVK